MPHWLRVLLHGGQRKWVNIKESDGFLEWAIHEVIDETNDQYYLRWNIQDFSSSKRRKMLKPEYHWRSKDDPKITGVYISRTEPKPWIQNPIDILGIKN